MTAASGCPGRVRESEYQRVVVDELRAVGAVVLNKSGVAAEGRGWPDLFVWHRIWTGAIELKVDDGKLSPSQRDRIRALRRQGCDALVLRLDSSTGLESADGQVLPMDPVVGRRVLPARGAKRLRMLAATRVDRESADSAAGF